MNLERSQHFFNLIAKPTAMEFLDSPGDVRKGCLAAIVLNQMIDYWVMSHREVRMTREQFSKVCPDILFIHDVADASKHAELSNRQRSPHSSDQIGRDPGLFEAPFGRGLFAEAVRVFVVFPNGGRRNLEPAIRAVLEFWEDQIHPQAKS